MQKLVKKLVIVLLAVVMVIGTSLTVMAANRVKVNPKTGGVQLVDDILMVNSDNHTMYVWGQAVAVQYPGFTDILPNNASGCIDAQFNGNLYTGLKGIMIIKDAKKMDAVILEKDSMLINNAATPEQMLLIRDVVSTNPVNLPMLRVGLNFHQELWFTQTYLVGDKGVIYDENGKSVPRRDVSKSVKISSKEQVLQDIENSTVSGNSL